MRARHGARHAPLQIVQAAVTLADAPAQQQGRKPRRGARQAHPLALRETAQCAIQPRGGGVQPLAGQGENVVGSRQGARGGDHPVASLLHAVAHGAQQAAAQIAHPGQQFGAHRHGHFRRRRWRWRARIGGVIDQRPVRLVAHRRDQRDVRGRRGAHHGLVVEAPQILHRAAAARHDEEIGPGDGPAFLQRVEAGDARRHLRPAGLALHAHRPDDDAARKALRKPVQDVADHRPGGRCDHADDPWQMGQRLLARLVEQSFRRQLLFALLEQRHERAKAGRLQLFDDELIFRLPRIGGDPAGGDHLHALFGLHLLALRDALPHDGGQHGAVVLQIEIDMPRGRARHPPQLAAHPHEAEGVLHGALDGPRNVRNRIFRHIDHRPGFGGGRFLEDFPRPGVYADAGCHASSPSLAESGASVS